MEVVPTDDNFGLIVWYALDAITPLSHELDRRLDRLGARIHRQRHVEVAELAEQLQEWPHAIVVKCARRQREPLSLLGERIDGTAMISAAVLVAAIGVFIIARQKQGQH